MASTAMAWRWCTHGSATPAAAVRVLRLRGQCLTCVFRCHARQRPRFAAEAARVNARTRFAALVEEGRPVWEPQSCPECSGGAGPVCRPHLIPGEGRSAPTLWAT